MGRRIARTANDGLGGGHGRSVLPGHREEHLAGRGAHRDGAHRGPIIDETQDGLVLLAQSEQLVERLNELGVPVDFRPVVRVDHVFEGYEKGGALVNEVVEFLTRMWRPGPWAQGFPTDLAP